MPPRNVIEYIGRWRRFLSGIEGVSKIIDPLAVQYIQTGLKMHVTCEFSGIFGLIRIVGSVKSK